MCKRLRCPVIPSRESGLTQIARRCLLVALLAFYSAAGFAQSVVCREDGIAGMDEPAIRAKRVIGEGKTSDVSRMKVYVTAYGGSLYLHSNFVTHGADNPTKIKLDETGTDLLKLAQNLVFAALPYGAESDRFTTEFIDKVEFDVEPSLFADARFGTLDFSGARNVKVIGNDHHLRPARLIGSNEGHPRWVVRYDEGLYASASVADVGDLKARLEGAPLDSSRIMVLPLLRERATEDAITSDIPKSSVIDFDLSSADALTATLAANTGQTIIALGHIEDYAFVVREGNGVRFSIGLKELRMKVEAAGATLFMLGCHSAAYDGFGVIGEPNSVDAVHRIAAALRLSSPNHLTFLKTLAGGSVAEAPMDLVVDDLVQRSDGTERTNVMVEFVRAVESGGPARTWGSVRFSIPTVATPPLPCTSIDCWPPSDDTEYFHIGVGFVIMGAVLYGIIRFVKNLGRT